jgi:hypothetical protein
MLRRFLSRYFKTYNLNHLGSWKSVQYTKKDWRIYVDIPNKTNTKMRDDVKVINMLLYQPGNYKDITT